MPDAGFHHEEHVRVAWFYLCRYPVGQALDRFTTALKAFAAAQGAPERYHETITTAYVLLINERLDATALGDWQTFAAAHPDLLAWKPSTLDRYYTPETLWSDRAARLRHAGRRGWRTATWLRSRYALSAKLRYELAPMSAASIIG